MKIILSFLFLSLCINCAKSRDVLRAEVIVPPLSVIKPSEEAKANPGEVKTEEKTDGIFDKMFGVDFSPYEPKSLTKARPAKRELSPHLTGCEQVF